MLLELIFVLDMQIWEGMLEISPQFNSAYFLFFILLLLRYLSSDEMIGDILTKNFSKIKHEKFVKSLGLLLELIFVLDVQIWEGMLEIFPQFNSAYFLFFCFSLSKFIFYSYFIRQASLCIFCSLYIHTYIYTFLSLTKIFESTIFISDQ